MARVKGRFLPPPGETSLHTCRARFQDDQLLSVISLPLPIGHGAKLGACAFLLGACHWPFKQHEVDWMDCPEKLGKSRQGVRLLRAGVTSVAATP
jgi:hypothetical protein